MLAIVTGDTLKLLKRDFKNKLFIDILATGLVATIPMSSIGGMRSLKYLTEGQKLDMEGGEKMSFNTEYELILVIANEGYTDLIMNAGAQRESNRRDRHQSKRHRRRVRKEIFWLYNCGRERNDINCLSDKRPEQYYESGYDAGGTRK